jgi:hypothetical protein
MDRKAALKTIEKTEMDDAALEGAAKASADLDAQYQVVAQQFGYTLTYNRERMVDEIRHYMGESARAMLEAGARLELIHGQASHGEWIETCNQLGIDKRLADRMRLAAKKFANGVTSPHLPQLERMGQSRLFELLVLDARHEAGRARRQGNRVHRPRPPQGRGTEQPFHPQHLIGELNGSQSNNK